MPTSWLNVPHLRQTTDGACLEACVAMVLAYLQQPMTESQISQLFEADDSGTPASRVRRLERWGFQITYGSTTLETLKAWLAQGIPPIALVYTEFLDYWTDETPHAVVVVGLEQDRVYLNDPVFDTVPQIASLDGFLAAWIEMDEIAAIITRRD